MRDSCFYSTCVLMKHEKMSCQTLACSELKFGFSLCSVKLYTWCTFQMSTGCFNRLQQMTQLCLKFVLFLLALHYWRMYWI